MYYLKLITYTYFLSTFGVVFSCAYFNTLYNAQQYFDQAETHRLEKEGKAIPISAMDKYSKTIQKCQKSLQDYPDSRWKIDAYLLMAKARFYRKDYDMAIENLDTVIYNGTNEQIDEARYWIAICKWKKGTSNTAASELKNLLKSTSYNFIKARCYLSLADIADEESMTEDALKYLEYGAELTKDRAQRGLIYRQLADLAFNRKSYEVAKNAYKQVITNSLSKEKIEKAHLQILKIYRMENEYKAASKKIKSMLVDDKFKNIAGNLELELVQIYISQKEFDESINRLESIVNEYQRTEVSAEAYYLLGQIYSTHKWDLSKSKEFFEKVGKEYSRSIYKPMANSRVKAIDNYMSIFSQYEKIKETNEKQIDSLLYTEKSIIDSTLTNDNKNRNTKSLPQLIYELADVEWFSFKRKNESITYFMLIVDNYEQSLFHPKALFTLSYIYRTVGDSINALKMENKLEKRYPDSDFVSFINSKISTKLTEEEKLFLKIQDEWSNNPDTSVELFNSLKLKGTRNDLTISAAYFLGYNFDQHFEIDSAMKYYTWLKENHPKSDQANIAKIRLNTLENVLTLIEVDTLDQENPNIDTN